MAKHKYLCIQRSQPESGGEAPSPVQMEEMYRAFNAWLEKYKENILDLGGKLEDGGKVLSLKGATDGPFAETKEIIGGFMIITAETMEEAMEVVRESPGVGMPGSTVEIREISTP